MRWIAAIAGAGWFASASAQAQTWNVAVFTVSAKEFIDRLVNAGLELKKEGCVASVLPRMQTCSFTALHQDIKATIDVGMLDSASINDFVVWYQPPGGILNPAEASAAFVSVLTKAFTAAGFNDDAYLSALEFMRATADKDVLPTPPAGYSFSGSISQTRYSFKATARKTAEGP